MAAVERVGWSATLGHAERERAVQALACCARQARLRPSRARRLGHDQDAARILVDAVHDSRSQRRVGIARVGGRLLEPGRASRPFTSVPGRDRAQDAPPARPACPRPRVGVLVAALETRRSESGSASLGGGSGLDLELVAAAARVARAAELPSTRRAPRRSSAARWRAKPRATAARAPCRRARAPSPERARTATRSHVPRSATRRGATRADFSRALWT